MYPIGTTVRLSEFGRHRYWDDDNNPYGELGTVEAYLEEDFVYPEEVGDDDYWYVVMWDNGNDNHYTYNDLEPVGQVTVPKKRERKPSKFQQFIRSTQHD